VGCLREKESYKVKNISLNDITLTLFFTGGVSLKTWIEVGNFEREIFLYEELSQCLKGVNLISYGGKKDKRFSDRLNNIKLMPVQWHKREINTVFELIMKYYPELRRTNVLKTNQIEGSEIPIWFKKRFGMKLITRCGYLHSYFVRESTTDERKIENAIKIERTAFTSADSGIVTSKWQKDIVVKNYNIDRKKIKVVPNYVITDIFKPNLVLPKDFDLIYVGRSNEQKNLKSLLEALYHLKRKNKKLSLLMIGGCSSDNNLRELTCQYDLDITFKDNVPNFKLPLFFNKSRIFILPSKYEGHPKALIEAMSCGLPCIGSDVMGIKEDIKHMENGYLCETNYESIAEAIDLVLSDEPLRIYMGKNARKYVLNNYSLDKILKKEVAVIREVIGK
jgi:glycosyltransferase involved in cell wall biosynthesis